MIHTSSKGIPKGVKPPNTPKLGMRESSKTGATRRSTATTIATRRDDEMRQGTATNGKTRRGTSTNPGQPRGTLSKTRTIHGTCTKAEIIAMMLTIIYAKWPKHTLSLQRTNRHKSGSSFKGGSPSPLATIKAFFQRMDNRVLPTDNFITATRPPRSTLPTVSSPTVRRQAWSETFPGMPLPRDSEPGTTPPLKNTLTVPPPPSPYPYTSSIRSWMVGKTVQYNLEQKIVDDVDVVLRTVCNGHLKNMVDELEYELGNIEKHPRHDYMIEYADYNASYKIYSTKYEDEVKRVREATWGADIKRLSEILNKRSLNDYDREVLSYYAWTHDEISFDYIPSKFSNQISNAIQLYNLLAAYGKTELRNLPKTTQLFVDLARLSGPVTDVYNDLYELVKTVYTKIGSPIEISLTDVHGNDTVHFRASALDGISLEIDYENQTNVSKENVVDSLTWITLNHIHARNRVYYEVNVDDDDNPNAFEFYYQATNKIAEALAVAATAIPVRPINIKHPSSHPPPWSDEPAQGGNGFKWVSTKRKVVVPQKKKNAAGKKAPRPVSKVVRS